MLNYKPSQPHKYQGKQVIITSDRVLFNAQNDSILLIADKSIGFNTTGTINFDIDGGESPLHNRFVVNSPNIYLGLDGKNPPEEPAVLANSLEIWLQELVDYLEDLEHFLLTRFKVISQQEGGLTESARGMNGVNDSTHFKELRDNPLTGLRNTIINIKSKKVKLI